LAEDGAGGGRSRCFLEDAVVGYVEEDDVAVWILDGGAGGEAAHAGSGSDGAGGGGLEDELRTDADTVEIDEVDDGVGAIGNGESAEAKANLLRGKRQVDSAALVAGQDAER